jgi:hypothetical protein
MCTAPGCTLKLNINSLKSDLQSVVCGPLGHGRQGQFVILFLSIVLECKNICIASLLNIFNISQNLLSQIMAQNGIKLCTGL